MRVILKLDAGDMLHKEECTITGQDTAGTLHTKLAQLGAKGLLKVLKQMETGTIHAQKQDENEVTYAEKLTKSEASVDWTLPAEQIARNVRGLNPWPVAQTVFNGEVLRIWQAEAVTAAINGEPGAIVSSHKTLDVATGKGVVRLLEVQSPGGKRLPVNAFLNSHHPDGVKFG
jgi:methionyl-tRNA formyltransferase